LTFSRLKGRYRLLVLDGHGSHLTPKFDKLCEENNIIPIYMPAHSSHLLQPLNIGCFAVLKRAYGRMVKTKIRNGINFIDKLDFLEAYPSARIEAFGSDTIINSFGAAGLVPFCPDRVILKLNIYLRTPTPPPSRGSDSSRNYTPKTPFTEKQLRRQALAIKALLRTRSQSPSPAFDQLIKGFQLSIHSALLLRREVSDLRAENEKKKQKQARSSKQMPAPEGLTVLEASVLIAQLGDTSRAPPQGQLAGPLGHS
jgi:hypothetical protein